MPETKRRSDKPDGTALANLLHGSVLLHQDSISLHDWLERFSIAADADGSASLRWTAGNPAHCLNSLHGAIQPLPADCLVWIDRIVRESSRNEPGFIEDFLRAGANTSEILPAAVTDPRILVGVVDWSPACIVVVATRSADREPWDDIDRRRVRTLLPYIRDSVSVHKLLDRSRYIAGLARDLLNRSPRGIVMLDEDRTIVMANTRGRAILAANNGLSEQHGKLAVDCRAASARLDEYLGKLDSLSDEGLPEMDWNMVARKRSGGLPYQLIVGHLKLSTWNLESRHSDKVAVVHMHDPSAMIGVQPEKLSDFYGFTKAQARLAAKLFHGHTVNEAAAALHISVNTARTHMRSIYAKTGVRTQAELLGLLSTGLMSYGQPIDDDTR